MNATTMTSQAPIGGLLRTWRERRKLSQLELSMAADISSRHLSFVETSRSSPSRDLVLRLCERLELPLRERNRLLLAAGYAPVFSQAAIDSPAMSPIRETLRAVLQSPYPVLVIDRRWSLVEGNDAALSLIQEVDPELMKSPANMLRLALHPRGMAPKIINFSQWRAHLLDRLRREAEFSRDPLLNELLNELLGYPCDRDESVDTTSEIVVPLRLRHEGRELAFLNTITTFGTPVDVTVAELMLESFFPADECTATAMRERRI
jgi:transcriptional regulator with XRE-family HTH domain